MVRGRGAPAAEELAVPEECEHVEERHLGRSGEIAGEIARGRAAPGEIIAGMVRAGVMNREAEAAACTHAVAPTMHPRRAARTAAPSGIGRGVGSCDTGGAAPLPPTSPAARAHSVPSAPRRTKVDVPPCCERRCQSPPPSAASRLSSRSVSSHSAWRRASSAASMPGRTSSLSAAVAAAAAREPGAAAMARRSSCSRAPASSSWSSAACVRMARTASMSCPRSFGSSAARVHGSEEA
jgi:hypothetical protein